MGLSKNHSWSLVAMATALLSLKHVAVAQEHDQSERPNQTETTETTESAHQTDDTGSVDSDPPDQGSARRHFSLSGPDSVGSIFEDDHKLKSPLLREELLKPYFEFKNNVQDDFGLSFGFDYSALYLSSTDSTRQSPGSTSTSLLDLLSADSPRAFLGALLGAARGRSRDGEDEAASGMFRFYGSWELLGRDTEHVGSFVFKVEHRHRYTNIAPNALASSLGQVGLVEPPFSGQGWRLTNLYWKQGFADNRYVVIAGFLDATDYVDAYALASPWLHFANFAFSTGSATIGLPNDATLGIAAGAWINDNIYINGGLVDLNSDPTDPLEGFDTFFNEHEFFKSLEVGWTSSRERAYLDNVHFTLWHSDEREEADVSDGWGVNFSASCWLDEKWMPFLRAGYANDGGSLLEKSLSAGIGYQAAPGADLLGFAVNWGQANEDTFGEDLGEQFTSELFYRWQLTEHTAITPSIQLLFDPALNPDHDIVGVFGLRLRTVF